MSEARKNRTRDLSLIREGTSRRESLERNSWDGVGTGPADRARQPLSGRLRQCNPYLSAHFKDWTPRVIARISGLSPFAKVSYCDKRIGGILLRRGAADDARCDSQRFTVDGGTSTGQGGGLGRVDWESPSNRRVPSYLRYANRAPIALVVGVPGRELRQSPRPPFIDISDGTFPEGVLHGVTCDATELNHT